MKATSNKNGPRDYQTVFAGRYVLTEKAITYLAELDQKREEEETHRGR